MPQISSALSRAREAIEHSQCGHVLQPTVAIAARAFGDRQALAVLLAVQHHPGADVAQKAEATELLGVWEQKCGHWRLDRQNAHNAAPELPSGYQDWQPFLAVALNEVWP